MIAGLAVDLLGRRRQAALGWLLLAAGLALLAWQGQRLWQVQSSLEAEREGVARLARAAVRPAAPAMSAADVRRHAQLERMARHLAAPWADMLALVERSSGRQVQLLHLTPDAESGRVAFTAQAANAAALSAFMLQLEKSPVLADVQILRHDRSATGPGIEFDAEARWRGIVPAPRAAGEGTP